MTDTENLAGDYFDKINTATNPAAVLVGFYSQLFELEYNAELIPFFTRLVRLYGRESVYYAIIECTTFPELKHENIFRLLSYLCSRKLKEKKMLSKTVDLSDSVQKMIVIIEKRIKTPIKVRSPFQ